MWPFHERQYPEPALAVGRRDILHRPNIDYVFTTRAEIELKSKADQVTKTSIGWVQADDFGASWRRSNETARPRWSSPRSAAAGAGQAELLKYYVGMSAPENERGAIEAFLKSEVGRWPVDVQWHRAYQTIAELNKHITRSLLRSTTSTSGPTRRALLFFISGDGSSRTGKNKGAVLSPGDQNRRTSAGPGWPSPRGPARKPGGTDLDGGHEGGSLNVSEPDRIAELILRGQDG